MRIGQVCIVLAITVAVPGMLGGCSGGYTSGERGLLGAVGAASAHPERASGANSGSFLYISDRYKRIVVFDERSNKQIRKITDGINVALRDWTDVQGNLYVANFGSAAVTEYVPGSSTPSCTYSKGLSSPVSGTTDEAGNVYVADTGLPSGNDGHIYEYQQCSNSILNTYDVDGPVGVAVDRKGDLFVAVEGFGFPPRSTIKEFIAGSTKGIFLRAWVNGAAAMCIDKKNNLIVGDWLAQTVDLIRPPYRKVTPFVSVPGSPYGCALNKKEDRLFIADFSVATVFVYSYPSGKLVKKYGRKNGIRSPEGVAVSPAAVF